MWIVSVDRDYYPYILKFKTEEKARIEFKYLKEKLTKDDVDNGIFIAEVNEFASGIDYWLEYENDEY